MSGGVPLAGPAQPRAHDTAEADWIPQLVRHLTHAVSAHVHWLYRQGLAAPPELESLNEFLLQVARNRQDTSTAAMPIDPGQSAAMSERLLVTKSEAAERLSVSIRTVERLVSSGRLPQVHVERSVRFRLSDLESYVTGLPDGLPDNDSGPPAPTG